MKKIIVALVISSLFSATSFGFGLKSTMTKDTVLSTLKYNLTCSEKNETCKNLCGIAAACDLPAVESCTDCYRDTDLSLRSLFNEPQMRYEVNEKIYSAESSARILKEKNLLIVGVRQNILMDPLKAGAYNDLQAIWNAMCPAPRDETADAFFLVKPFEDGYKPFALMCGDQIHKLQYEISYGRGAVVEDANEETTRPENMLILKMSNELGLGK